MWPKSLRFASVSALVCFAFSLVFWMAPAAAAGQAEASVGAVPSRLTQAIDDKQLTPLRGTVHRLASAANDRGAVEASTPLDRVQIMLKRSDAQEAGLKQTIEEMHTPGSAGYHKWLTPEEFGKQFGPSNEDVATLTAWLGTHGFTVTKLNPGRQTLEVSGTAGQFEQTFHAQIHKYQVNGETHFANASDPQIPAALAPVFGGFASLNNFRYKSNAKILGKATFDPATHTGKASWSEGLNGVSLFLAPGDFAKQYDLNPVYSGGTTGAGQTIAIINEANISIALVNQYRSLFGLSANPPTVIIDGSDPGIEGMNNPSGPNFASVEAYLDVELAGSVAPDATIDLVIAGDTATSSGLLLAAERAVYGNVAPVLSLSFGGCEAGQQAAGNAYWNALWQQAAAQGQTVLVSSGDAGSAGCDNDNVQNYAVAGQAVNGLASTPYNVAVGGTDFHYASNADVANYWNLTASNSAPSVSLLKVAPEQPWNDSQFGLNLNNIRSYPTGTSIAGGSGGASNCATGAPSAYFAGSGGTCKGYAKPAWQTGPGVPADGVRDLPDLSLFAANGLNYSSYPICASDGDCQPAPAGGDIQIFGVGGTSASTPAFAGIMALVNQKYGRQGQANFVLYPMAKQFPTAFHDVTAGTISMPCATTNTSYNGSRITPIDCISVANPITVSDPNFGSATEGQIGNTSNNAAEYNAGGGYDLASGLGTIDANVLLTNWNSVAFTSTTTKLTPSQTSFSHGTSITVSGTVSPAASTGTVALLTDSGKPLNPAQSVFTLAGGAFSGNVNDLPGGTYNVYGEYSGDGVNMSSTSPKTQITVTPEASTLGLKALNVSGGTAISSGGTVTYGTQLLLTATPAPTSGSTGPATGRVTFTDGSTTLTSTAVNIEGSAFYNAAPAVGTHSITAAYSGDASYNASNSSALALTVVKDTPELFYLYSGTDGQNLSPVSGGTAITVTLVNNANGNAPTSSSNGGYLFTPVAAPTGVVTLTGLPTGTLTSTLASTMDPRFGLPEGATTVAVPAGIATGTYNITFSYPGDANYNSYTLSGSIAITASSALTSSTSVAASSTSTSTTSRVTASTTITGQPGKSAPTGTIEFLVAGYRFGPYSLGAGTGDNVTFTRTFSTANLLTGVNTITAQYSGDVQYAPSAGLTAISNGATANFSLSSSGPITVAAGSTGSATISATPAGGFTGTVALSCTVTPSAASGAPTCSIGSATISGVGAATATLTVNTTSSTPGGTYVATVSGTNGSVITTTSVPVTVTAQPSFSLSNGGAITVTAGNSGSSVVTVTPSGGFTGAVVLTCSVTPTTGTSVPTCSIANATVTGTMAVMSTLTVNTTSTTAAGAYTVTVTGVNGSTSKTTAVGLTVNAAPVPAIALSSTAAAAIPVGGGTTTSTITVTASNGFTGPVALTCAVAPTSGTSVPTCLLNPTSVTTSGNSTLTVTDTSTTTAGVYMVTVTGMAAGVPNATTTVSVTQSAPAPPTPTVTLSNSAPITISAPGQSGTSTVTVTPGGGFTGPVALTCAVAPTNQTDTPGCTVTTPVTITGTTAGTATLTVTTTAAAAAMEHPRIRLLPIGGGVAMATLLFFLVPVRRRRLTTLLGAMVLMAVVGFSSGCGGGGTPIPKDQGTTVGNYTVTVSGTASSVTIAPITVAVTLQ